MSNEKYPIQLVVLIIADNENDLHDKRHIVRSIGFQLDSYEEDDEGGMWKCIGENIYHCNKKRHVRGYAKKLKKLDFLLFEDSSAIVGDKEYDLPDLLKF